MFFRVIPVLLIDNEECLKIIKFDKKIYIGDPIHSKKKSNPLWKSKAPMKPILKLLFFFDLIFLPEKIL